jgi:hypothetical protein
MRRRSLRVLGVILVCLSGLTALGCNLFQKNEAPSFSREFGWATSNVDPSYWEKLGDTDPPTAFCLFQVSVDDPDGYGDIDEIDVIHPTGVKTWYLEEDYNSDGGYWGGWYYYDQDNPHAVALGTYTVAVRDSAGHEINGSISFNSPGSSSSSGFIYSEDYVLGGGSTAGGEPMISRAANVTGILNPDNLSISFTVDDDRVVNGWIWFYDSSFEYVT